ncbi:class I mannose-6-phosphate isomerase [Balneolaceae bacterium]|jgi:mannose-6-phosphate isomerase class I|nr:class I mannose-6-phosphate isomerase [Balneolaceae bacterium]
MYNKNPTIKISSEHDKCILGWKAINDQIAATVKNLKNKNSHIVVECYQGCDLAEIRKELSSYFDYASIIDSSNYMKPELVIRRMTQSDVTDHRVFGVITKLRIHDFFETAKIEHLKRKQTKTNLTIYFGIGASLLVDNPDILIYADMARWEIQQRMRKNLVDNIGVNNRQESLEEQYKRAYFVDWRVCDELKKDLLTNLDFVLDTNTPSDPKLATGNAIRSALTQAISQPFSVVPYFDAGPWGGQWMKEKFDLDENTTNFAWSFNCVPEENSLLIEFSNSNFEIPSINVVFYKPLELLGPAIYNEFGAEFPIRFDFLDTMDGGNLSLQVHPVKEYIMEQFGMTYTQDESYYIIDAGDDAFVYLGTNDKINPNDMLDDLKRSQSEGHIFDAEKYATKWSAKKHDHFLIPAGTVHCSGKDCMVLEISATPYIFTFKLWDWGRLGMDGRPRPISIEHGQKVIQWDRTSDWTRNNLINQFEEISCGDGWIEEKTGLHDLEFIETRRQWFNCKVYHNTENTLNVLMIIDGEQAIIESPTDAFDPFIVNFCEAFIVPANVGEYTVKPTGLSKNKKIALIKAFVKLK